MSSFLTLTRQPPLLLLLLQREHELVDAHGLVEHMREHMLWLNQTMDQNMTMSGLTNAGPS